MYQKYIEIIFYTFNNISIPINLIQRLVYKSIYYIILYIRLAYVIINRPIVDKILSKTYGCVLKQTKETSTSSKHYSFNQFDPTNIG